METQNKRLIEYLRKHDSIDPLEAWQKLGIYRLSARVHDLRNDANQIVTHTKELKNSFGEVVKVASYSLKKYALKKDDQYFFDIIKGSKNSLTNSVFLAKRFTAKEADLFGKGFEKVIV